MSMLTSQLRREQGPQGPQDVSEVSTLVSSQSTTQDRTCGSQPWLGNLEAELALSGSPCPHLHRRQWFLSSQPLRNTTGPIHLRGEPLKSEATSSPSTLWGKYRFLPYPLPTPAHRPPQSAPAHLSSLTSLCPPRTPEPAAPARLEDAPAPLPLCLPLYRPPHDHRAPVTTKPPGARPGPLPKAGGALCQCDPARPATSSLESPGSGSPPGPHTHAEGHLSFSDLR